MEEENFIPIGVAIKEEPVDPDEIDNKIDRARRIIQLEFQQEVEERENQVISIQKQIQEAQHSLAVLKYVASYEYYQGKFEIKKEGESNTEYAPHPCVKSLFFGQEPPTQETSKEEAEEDPLVSKSAILEDSSKKTLSENVTIVRGTYRVKHQVVIGNVSQWIPPALREDDASHKWMLYIRKKENDSELQKIIKKVRYFLHESYKPHDIIDVTTAPFHLTRRGWGEFPVRVTLYFHHPLNKPVDLIHELKLDHTFSGRNTLGGETVVELNLIHDNVDELLSEETSEKTSAEVVGKAKYLIANDHDYCSTEKPSKTQEAPKIKQSASHYTSIDDEKSDFEVLEKWNPETDGPVVEWYKNEIIKRGSDIYFFSSEACIKWLLKRWPLISRRARVDRYKNVHPYAFATVEEYLNANVGKRAAAEWYRAWKVKEILKNLNLVPWTTKQIILFARMHGYTHFIGKQHFAIPSEGLQNINTFTNNIDTSSDLRQLENCIAEEDLDIVGVEKPKQASPFKRLKPVTIVTNWVKVVEIFSKQIGIRFGDEELAEGVSINAPVVLLAHAVKLFLDDLIRKSSCNAWLRNECRNPGTLEVADILQSLLQSPEFEMLTNAGLGSKINFTEDNT